MFVPIERQNVGVLTMSCDSVSLHPWRRENLCEPTVDGTRSVAIALIDACHRHHAVHHPG